MIAETPKLSPALQTLSDEEVVERVLAGETELFEILMRRYNQRLYRVARAILVDDGEAEDVMQDAYVRAYAHLDQFARRSRFSTWLTRIAVYEALARARRGKRLVGIDHLSPTKESSMSAKDRGPEQLAIQRDLRTVLEVAVAALPESFRSVLVLRDVEGLSTAETAESLGISEALVKTRLHRAHAALRREMENRTGAALAQSFQFHLSRCDRVVEAVFPRIRHPEAQGVASPF
ncbi:MAG TPA: RNA polymerase sigma factor [Thermoanaerobaculia bacterium]|nr:RNA polymerase sigma factor [Thermoanaerobaculia bacterium]